MIVDPNQVMALTATSVAPIPTPTGIPTVPIPEYYQKAGTAGKNALWVVFIIMLVATVIFSVVSFQVPIAKRLYHVITTFIVTFAALSYFAMAAGDGISYHKNVVKGEDGNESIVYREVYWARYVDWSVTTPLLLLDLALLAGLSGGNIVIAIVADVIMVITGLFAAFGDEESPAKWGWYAIACIAYLILVWQLAINGRATAFGKGGKVGSFFASIAGFTFIIWTVYPIVWGVADGARIADHRDQEIIAYAILDVLAKPVFGAWLLYTHSVLPETNIELGGFWTHGLTGEGGIRVGDDDEGA